ncbi:MAG: cobalamin biosynthesis bifunctional protein CbiET [Candidatus Latescibacterota bacterium]|nr:MAG: cobalamin biosynthesis bifunctional protein CbiET [Candidatus Latescibacterota bacterium]
MWDRVYIVGVGPEGPESLPPKALRLIEEAEIVFGGERLLEMFPKSEGEKVPLKHNLSDVSERIKANIGRKRMVVLASGDPCFYGIAGYLVGRLGKENIEIIPNVSSVQLAFSRIKESWEEAAFVSVHGRPIETILEKIESPKLAVLADSENNPAAIARFLLEHGLEDFRAFVCEDLGTERERVFETDLKTLSQMEGFSPLSVSILVRKGNFGRRWGIPEEEFSRRKGLITKLEVRAVSLAKLGISEGSIIWDIGAGPGSISIEASFLLRRGKVFAVEKDPEQVKLLEQNIRKFKAWNVKPVLAEAPDGLESLPDPDAVFVGGSGGRLEEILEIVCSRLRLGGRIVLNLATLENLSLALQKLEEKGLETEVTLVNISRGTRVSDLTRLEPLNPVFVLTGRK